MATGEDEAFPDQPMLAEEGVKAPPSEEEKRRLRGAKFGNKSESEKAALRKTRFGITTESEKAALRKERFGLQTDEEKKALRAQRFAAKEKTSGGGEVDDATKRKLRAAKFGTGKTAKPMSPAKEAENAGNWQRALLDRQLRFGLGEKAAVSRT